MRRVVLTAILAIAVAQNARSAEITFDAKAMTRDESVLVILVDTARDDVAGFALTAHYNPNSIVESVVEIGVTDSTGAVTWTPEHAGMVTLAARRGDVVVSRSVGVRFPALPGGAVVVFLFAGTVLLGGAGWSLVRLMEHEPKHGLK
jgi:hypothetical protein